MKFLFTSVFIITTIGSGFCNTIELTDSLHKKIFFFDEFVFSVNRTNVVGNQFNPRNGLGIAGTHSFSPNKSLQVIMGFEYNFTHHFKNYEYWGHFGSATNIDYSLMGLFVKLGLKYFIDNRNILFAESGILGGIVMNVREKGLANTLVFENGNYFYKEYSFTSNEFNNDVFYGLYVGVGIKIKGIFNGILIKTDYINRKGIQDSDIFFNYYQFGIGVCF